MTKEQATQLTAKVLAATKYVQDPSEKVKIGAKVMREEFNKLQGMPDNQEELMSELQETRRQIEELGSQLLTADRAIYKRVRRSIELVRENRTLRLKAAKKDDKT